MTISAIPKCGSERRRQRPWSGLPRPLSSECSQGLALLAGLRDRLLNHVLGLLEADPAVAGVAMVGSLGRGEEDRSR